MSDPVLPPPRPINGRCVPNIDRSQVAHLTVILAMLARLPASDLVPAGRHAVIRRVLEAALDWEAWMAAGCPLNEDGDDIADEALTWRAIDWEMSQEERCEAPRPILCILGDLGMLDE